MSQQIYAADSAPEVAVDTTLDNQGIGGHPRGLTTLFFTEMWERFSYYGMRALLMLYMTGTVAVGGLGFETKKAASIYGAYVGSVYLMSIPGGWLADNVFGTGNSVLIGGIIIALGHFSMAIPSLPTFFAGLILITLGTGLLKPNVSAIVGGLYSEGDERRDAGFSIFYMGINLGAFLAPLIVGPIGEKINWHIGFSLAGIGMVIGVIQYTLGRRRLRGIGQPPAISPQQKRQNAIKGVLFTLSISLTIIGLYFGPDYIRLPLLFILGAATVSGLIYLFGWYLKPEEKKPVAVIGILFIFSAIFWMAFEQAGSSLNLFARDMTDRVVLGHEFAASILQAVNAVFIVLMAPVMAWLWLKLGNRQPSSPTKFALGLLFAGLGFVVIGFAASMTTGGSRVSPMWLIVVYFLHTIGELCLSPVGLSTTTKLSPPRLAGLMMGVWFLSISIGNYAAGYVAGFFEGDSQGAVTALFYKVAGVTIVASIILMVLTPSIRKLMGKVR
ncbi:MAG: peptide MFS transporter [Blastocatellia bacterium]